MEIAEAWFNPFRLDLKRSCYRGFRSALLRSTHGCSFWSPSGTTENPALRPAKKLVGHAQPPKRGIIDIFIGRRAPQRHERLL